LRLIINTDGNPQGIQSEGLAPLNNQDKMEFANQLDRLLAKAKRS
jgi:uncharacterized protein YaiI (UPF0178 family)